MLENSKMFDWLTLQNPFSKISKQVILAPTLRKDKVTSEDY